MRSHAMQERPPDCRGSATIWMVALIALVWVVATAVAVAGGIRGARHRAEAAADLAALAGARSAVLGEEDPCGTASAVARANGARMRECRLDGVIVTIDAEIRLSAWIPGDHVARGRARAGPAATAGIAQSSVSRLKW